MSAKNSSTASLRSVKPILCITSINSSMEIYPSPSESAPTKNFWKLFTSNSWTRRPQATNSWKPMGRDLVTCQEVFCKRCSKLPCTCSPKDCRSPSTNVVRDAFRARPPSTPGVGTANFAKTLRSFLTCDGVKPSAALYDARNRMKSSDVMKAFSAVGCDARISSIVAFCMTSPSFLRMSGNAEHGTLSCFSVSSSLKAAWTASFSEAAIFRATFSKASKSMVVICELDFARRCTAWSFGTM
mmetsp:Transcript_136881/g.263113  ORF Transcript_136881/g.263113 Transcript_136881/m.263113 type:complete len:242 (+) Transcript_136881:1526-2251(+)